MKSVIPSLLFAAVALGACGGGSSTNNTVGSSARTVAERLTAHDALAAQLESEFGFDEPMPAAVPLLSQRSWPLAGAGRLRSAATSATVLMVTRPPAAGR